MILKSRSKSTTQRVLEYLNVRTKLQYEVKIKLKNQIKGFEGEEYFDSYLEEAGDKGIILNDLVINYNGNIFQLDSLLILNEKIYIFEIKNYSGNFYWHEDSILGESGYEILNPKGQINRSKVYLKNILKSLNISCTVDAQVVFTHPGFHMYHSTPKDPFIFRSQLKNFFNILFNQPLISDNKQHYLANQLLKRHIENYRPDNLPIYQFKELKKGVYCSKCYSYECTETRQNRYCKNCGTIEKSVDAIIRLAEEYKTLFPEEKATPRVLHHFSDKIYSRNRIFRVLNK